MARILGLTLLVALVAFGLTTTPQPVQAAGGMTFTDISAGYGHNCAVNADGAVWCWGNSSRGVLGSATTAGNLPRPVPELQSGVTDISAGAYHTCALMSDETVLCWGDNEYGQLGAASAQDCGTPQYPRPCSRVPLEVGSLTDIAAVSAGGEHTCALLSSGGAKCWGSNEYGQLGDGTWNDSQSPVDVLDSNGDPLLDLTAITAGYEHNCALTSAGGVVCWGENEYGQLGDGTLDERHTSVDAVGLQSGVAHLSDGSSSTHTCAVLVDGSVKCWGANYFGQLGDGTSFVHGTSEVAKATPVDVAGLSTNVVQVATSDESGGSLGHTCSLLTDGSVMCWGGNDWSQLGNGRRYGGPSSEPKPVCVDFDPFFLECQQALSGVSLLAAGGFHSCAAASANEARCWGTNVIGQLGAFGSVDGGTAIEVGFDADADGLADAYEYSHACLDSKSAQSVTDADGDGLSNLDEANRQMFIGFPGGTSAGLRTDACLFDTDADGCSDGQERDIATVFNVKAANFLSFFDTPDAAGVRDKSVSALDIFRLVGRFGATGEPLSDPLTVPPASPQYHAAFDRTSLGTITSSAMLGPGDGAISATDIFAMLGQFGHSCA